MTNEKSKQAWQQLGTSISKGDCRFSAVKVAASHQSKNRQQTCGHGFRAQERQHLTERGQAILALSYAGYSS